jgi:hypothetical protein
VGLPLAAAVQESTDARSPFKETKIKKIPLGTISSGAS